MDPSGKRGPERARRFESCRLSQRKASGMDEDPVSKTGAGDEPVVSSILTFSARYTKRMEENTERYRSGQIAKTSGQYEIIGAAGEYTGDERTVTKGEPFPPTPDEGQTYVLADKTRHPTDR